MLISTHNSLQIIPKPSVYPVNNYQHMKLILLLMIVFIIPNNPNLRMSMKQVKMTVEIVVFVSDICCCIDWSVM